jgi:hypothetical protein
VKHTSRIRQGHVKHTSSIRQQSSIRQAYVSIRPHACAASLDESAALLLDSSSANTCATYVSIHQHYVRIRQHTSALRQHTSAYVSITSAYVCSTWAADGRSLASYASSCATILPRLHLLRQYLYSCTSKASKIGIIRQQLRDDLAEAASSASVFVLLYQ